MKIYIPAHVQDACACLIEQGFQAYIVGGAVRDSLLGLSPLDWDIVTDALPSEVETVFPTTIATGKQFGTITVILDNYSLEVTTMRSDGPYSDGRHPDYVAYTQELTEDLNRRDFTINAIAYDPFAAKIIDPFSGRRHLRKKLLQTVGDPSLRFAEDPLRMLRLIRFKAVLGFKVLRKTRKGIDPLLIKKVSPERIYDELNKLLVGKNLGPALRLFYQSGLMNQILPELAACKDISPGDNHPYDLLGHLITASHFATPELEIRWAALLHDIGKVVAAGREHEQHSAELAGQILRRLKASNKLISQVTTLVGNHMFEIHPHSSDKAIRRFLAKLGAETAYQLIKLRQADMAGLNLNPRTIIDYGQLLEARFDDIIGSENALTLKDLAIDGRIIMNKLELKPGPQVGKLLNYLFEQVLEDPKLNQEDLLLEQARNYLRSEQEISPLSSDPKQ